MRKKLFKVCYKDDNSLCVSFVEAFSRDEVKSNPYYNNYEVYSIREVGKKYINNVLKTGRTNFEIDI